MLKKFICLAKSYKNGGYCIAGKEILPNGKIGGWIRPIHPEHNSIPMNNFIFDVGDIITFEISDKHKHRTQPENYILAENPGWKKSGKIDSGKFNLLIDTPNSLWGIGDGFSSKYGLNDRVHENIASSHNNSLLFLFLPRAVVWKREQRSGEENKIKHRLNFIFNDVKYSLVITDPKLLNLYKEKLSLGNHEVINNIFVTISLAEPYYGYCYKLIVWCSNV